MMKEDFEHYENDSKREEERRNTFPNKNLLSSELHMAKQDSTKTLMAQSQKLH
ncbi:MAG: hypothetical protein IPK55_12415 [Streptococcus sp.]|nr:hypothetical protein [Streptococcus sp.]